MAKHHSQFHVSGWPSGLRRCVQVAVSSGGVGSNPTSDNVFVPVAVPKDRASVNINKSRLCISILWQPITTLRVYSRNTTSLFSKRFDFILKAFRLYSRSVSNLFSKRFDFILGTFRLYSRNVSTLFSERFDFILGTFRLYSRNVSTLFSERFDFILGTFREYLCRRTYVLLLSINILYTVVKCARICWFTNAIYIQDFYSSELKLPMLIWLYHVLNSYNLIYSSNGRWLPNTKSTGLWALRSGCHSGLLRQEIDQHPAKESGMTCH